MSIIKPGVRCRVIGGMDDDGADFTVGRKGPNFGKIVTVSRFIGEHDAIGNVWRCSCEEGLITYYGAVGNSADFPAGLLEPLLETLPPLKVKEEELV